MRWLVSAAATLLACSGSPEGGGGGLQVFTDWIRVEALCADYSFRGPPETVARELPGFDYCVEEWTTSGCTYIADYSSSASDLSPYRGAMGYQELQEVVGGRDASLVTAELNDTGPRFTAAVTIPEVAAGIRLTVDGRCQSSAAQQDGLNMLRTLVLPE